MGVTNCPIDGMVLGQDLWMVQDSSTFISWNFSSVIWSSLWKNKHIFGIILHFNHYTLLIHSLWSTDVSYCLHNFTYLPIWKITLSFLQASSFRLNIVISFCLGRKRRIFSQKYFNFCQKYFLMLCIAHATRKRWTRNAFKSLKEHMPSLIPYSKL